VKSYRAIHNHGEQGSHYGKEWFSDDITTIESGDIPEADEPGEAGESEETGGTAADGELPPTEPPPTEPQNKENDGLEVFLPNGQGVVVGE
jgi:hypothetical protein